MTPLLIIGLGLLALFVILKIADPLPIQTVRTLQFDYLNRLLPRGDDRLPVSIVTIDEKSLQQLGQWPWPRSYMAKLVDNLAKQKASAIGFDIVFAEADRHWLEEKSNVILPKQGLTTTPKITHDQLFSQSIEKIPVVLGELADASLPKQVNLNKHVDKMSQAIDFLPILPGLIENIPELSVHAKGAGILSLPPEHDGVVRKVPTFFNVQGKVRPSMGMELIRVATYGEYSPPKYHSSSGLEAVSVSGLVIPTDKHGLSRVYYRKSQAKQFISAVDVIHGRLTSEQLSGHIVLVGVTASGLHDIKPVPLGYLISGVEIWAQWIESSLFGTTLNRPSYFVAIELFALVVLCLSLIFLANRGYAKMGLIIWALITSALVFLVWILYAKYLLLLDVTYLIFCGFILYLALSVYNYYRQEQHQKIVAQTFSQYVAPKLVDKIIADPMRQSAEAKILEITSLFTDLADFTTLVETTPVEKVVPLMNDYIDGICRIVMEEFDGTVDKIIGDGINVIFGAPTKQIDHAYRAVNCALAIARYTNLFQLDRQSQGINCGMTRIGINTGSAVVGNFGGALRLNYTAQGDVINVASRLEGANKVLGTQICLSESTANNVRSKISLLPIGRLLVKGKSQDVMTFTPVSAVSNGNDLFDDYEKAYRCISHDMSKAKKLFKQLATKHPTNQLVLLQYKLLEDSNYSGLIDVSKL